MIKYHWLLLLSNLLGPRPIFSSFVVWTGFIKKLYQFWNHLAGFFQNCLQSCINSSSGGLSHKCILIWGCMWASWLLKEMCEKLGIGGIYCCWLWSSLFKFIHIPTFPCSYILLLGFWSPMLLLKSMRWNKIRMLEIMSASRFRRLPLHLCSQFISVHLQSLVLSPASSLPTKCVKVSVCRSLLPFRLFVVIDFIALI